MTETMFMQIIKSTILGLLLITLFVSELQAQVSTESELFQTLKEKDYEMFVTGFNQCDIKNVAALTHNNYEFYHDRDGITQSKESFINAIKTDICGTGSNVISRKLNEGSLQVFPMYREGELYAAIQTGEHSFGNTTALFTHLWLFEEDNWKLSRVLSYNHHREESNVHAATTKVMLTSDELNRYVGKYQFSPDFVLTMVQEGGKLYGDSQGEKVEIKPYEKNKFVAIDNSVKVHFDVHSSGETTGLIMVTPDGSMPATKIQ